MRYTVVLEQEEDGGYVASVPALSGCVSLGNARAEAVKNIREAVEVYVEDCRDAGDPVPTEAGKEFVEIETAKRIRAQTNKESLMRCHRRARPGDPDCRARCHLIGMAGTSPAMTTERSTLSF
jgi:predicted RNase H-like HicB family nuclease